MAAQFPITAFLNARVDSLVKAARRGFDAVKGEAVRAGEKVDDSLGAKGGRFRRVARSVGKKALGGVRSGAKAVGGFVSANVGLAARRVFQLESVLDDLGTQADASEAQVNELRSTVTTASAASGIARVKIGEAVQTLVDLQGGSAATADNVDLLNRALKASGANGKDLSGVMFAVNEAFFNGTAESEDLEKALSAILTVGKEASIPLSQLAVTLQQTAAKFKDVAVEAGGVEQATDLASALQAARTAFGSASEAGTGLRAAIGALVGKSKDLKKFGVNVFNVGNDGTRTLKPLRDILDQIAKSPLAKRPDLLQKALGSSEALAFTKALMENRDTWDELAERAKDSDSIQSDFMRKTTSQVGRANKAMNNFNLAFERLLSPERVEVFLNAFGAVVDLANKFVAELEVVGESLGSLAGRLVAGDVAEEQQRHLRENQLLMAQLTAFRRGRISPQQARLIRQNPQFRSEEDVRAEAGRRTIALAAQEGFVRDGQIQTEFLKEQFGTGRGFNLITSLRAAQEAAASRPSPSVTIAPFAASERQSPGPELGPVLQQIAANQQRIADTQERVSARLAMATRLSERSGVRK